MLYDRNREPGGFDANSELIRAFGLNGLRGYWSFRNGSLVDYSGSSSPSDASKVRSPVWKGGQYGGPRGRWTAYYCSNSDTSSNYITIPASSYSSLNGQLEGSVTCWAWLGNNPSTYATGVYSDLASLTYNGFGIEISTTGGVYGQVRTAASGGTQNTTASVQLVTARWYHLVLTYTSGYCRLYVNGKFAIYLAGTSGSIQSGAGTQIGARRTYAVDDTNTRTLNGFVGEIAVYSRVLSTKAIYDYYVRSILYEGSPVTKYFPAYYIAPPAASRQRASRTPLKLSEPRNLFVAPTTRPNTYFTLENSSLVNYGKTNPVTATSAGVTYTSCPVLGGGAATFAGSSGSYISSGTSNVVIADTGFFISFWIKWNHLTTGEYTDHGNMICGFDATGAGTFWYFRFRNPSASPYPSALESSAYQYTGAIWRSNFSSTMNVIPGPWYHFAAYINFLNYDSIRWYMNGQLVPGNTNSNGNWSSFATPITDFRLGWAVQTAGYASSIAGSLREFQIINRYVHPQAVADYYKARLAQPSIGIPAIYMATDKRRVRAAMYYMNKVESLVKGDIRSSL